MKLKSTLLAATLAVFVASSATAFAAEEHPADAKAEKAEATKTDTDKAKQPEKKKVKRHSHSAEKTGIPASEAATGKSHKESMDKDMPMHDHTIDRH